MAAMNAGSWSLHFERDFSSFLKQNNNDALSYMLNKPINPFK